MSFNYIIFNRGRGVLNVTLAFDFYHMDFVSPSHYRYFLTIKKIPKSYFGIQTIYSESLQIRLLYFSLVMYERYLLVVI